MTDLSARRDFDGETYDRTNDGKRLGKQLQAVLTRMRAREWQTLREIAYAVQAPESSVSARLRDLRKERFGGYVIDRQLTNIAGLWEYRLIAPPRADGKQGELFCERIGGRDG